MKPTKDTNASLINFLKIIKIRKNRGGDGDGVES